MFDLHKNMCVWILTSAEKTLHTTGENPILLLNQYIYHRKDIILEIDKYN